MRRRAVLTALGTAGASLAGCGALPAVGPGGGSAFEQASDAWRRTTRDVAGGATTLSATLVVGAGQYAARFTELSTYSEFRVAVEVLEGGPIDVATIPWRQFGVYKDEQSLANVDPVVDLTQYGTTSATLSALLRPGKYLTLFDNTTAGRTDPSGSIRASVELALTPQG